MHPLPPAPIATLHPHHDRAAIALYEVLRELAAAHPMRVAEATTNALAARLEVSPRTIIRAIAKLVAGGSIARRRRGSPTPATGGSLCNLYTVFDVDADPPIGAAPGARSCGCRKRRRHTGERRPWIPRVELPGELLGEKKRHSGPMSPAIAEDLGRGEKTCCHYTPPRTPVRDIYISREAVLPRPPWGDVLADRVAALRSRGYRAANAIALVAPIAAATFPAWLELADVGARDPAAYLAAVFRRRLTPSASQARRLEIVGFEPVSELARGDRAARSVLNRPHSVPIGDRLQRPLAFPPITRTRPTSTTSSMGDAAGADARRSIGRVAELVPIGLGRPRARAIAPPSTSTPDGRANTRRLAELAAALSAKPRGR